MLLQYAVLFCLATCHFSCGYVRCLTSLDYLRHPTTLRTAYEHEMAANLNSNETVVSLTEANQTSWLVSLWSFGLPIPHNFNMENGDDKSDLNHMAI